MNDTAVPAKPKPELMVKKEVALFCRVEVRTVERWLQTGRLKFVRLPGGHVRIRRCDVVVMLDAELSGTSATLDPGLG